MSNTALFRFHFCCSLALVAATLTLTGCDSRQRGREVPTERDELIPAPVSVPGEAEPAAVPETAEPSATASAPAAIPDAGEAPATASATEVEQPESLAAGQPEEPPAPQAARSAPVEEGPRAESPRPPNPSSERPMLGVNPLRGGAGQAAEQPATGSDPPSTEKPATGKGKEDEVPFDPIKENGPIFVNWPDPKLALVITGRQDGYLEPCGCAGLERMKGGLSRRLSMFEDLRNTRGWPVVAVDVGGLIKGYGRQAELKFNVVAVEAMRMMGYDAIGLGKSDLRLPAGELLSATASLDDQKSPFLSANVALFGFDAGLTASKRIVEAGGMKVGVTAILGKKWQEEIHNDDIELADPEEKLAGVVPELKQECNLLVLLAHATKDESIELARKFGFHLVVTADGAPEPPAKAEKIDGTETMLIEVGEKGMNAVVLGFYDDATRPVRYQRVPLDSRFANSKDVMLLMAAYQDQLKELGLEGLGIREVPHPQKELLGGFVGSEKCESCHETSYKVWKKSGHAKAWSTLVKQDPPRNFDPECISCHVVGWDPQHYFPYQSGFLSEEKTPHLINTGCESCHGPGEKHVEAEMGADFELQAKLQKAIVVTKEESEKRQCYTCHDLDNSPDFEFETYWPKVEHYEE